VVLIFGMSLWRRGGDVGSSGTGGDGDVFTCGGGWTWEVRRRLIGVLFDLGTGTSAPYLGLCAYYICDWVRLVDTHPHCTIAGMF
jgi:hypothetical protein